jgi:hypoxanthine phosphoribosyltransferase
VVFCVMNGGLIFAGKLLTHLQFPLEASYLHATRYRNETSGGELFWKPSRKCRSSTATC